MLITEICYCSPNMAERTNTTNDSENKSKLRLTTRGKGAIAITAAIAAGATLAATHPSEISEFASAAQRIFDGPPATSNEAAPKPVAQQEIDTLIENARKNNDPNVQFGTDIVVTGPETSLYDEALAQVPSNLLDINRNNIQTILLESAKTANTDQPDTPYITQPGQAYEVIMDDVNGDGYGEFVVALKENKSDSDDTVPAPITH